MSNHYKIPDLKGGYQQEDFTVVLDEDLEYKLSDFGFYLLSYGETEVPPITPRLSEYTLMDNKKYSGFGVGERVVLLTGRFHGATLLEIDNQMARLSRLLLAWETILRSTKNNKELYCRYVDGMTGNISQKNGYEVVLRFVADNPWWHATTPTEAVALANGSNTITYRGTAYGLPVLQIIATADNQAVRSVSVGDTTLTFDGVTVDTGKRFYLDLSDRTEIYCVAGDTLYPGSSIWYGGTSVIDKMTEDSIISRMRLSPGENVITLDIDTPMTATISWTERYWSLDR